jgi:uncharacterized membrane protein YdjX (TVP38/TMEM64 family)
MAEVRRDRTAWVKLGVLVAILAGGAMAAAFTPLGDYLSRDGVGAAIDWLRGSSAAPLVYIAIYAAATALAIPGSILTLAGGAMFGVAWGTVYTTVGANLGANAAFGIARFLGRDAVEQMAGTRLEKMDKATENHGFRGLLTLRLIPAVPFNALNFGSGLTAIPWPTYALATVIGIFPGTFVYTMFADALLAGSQEASREALLRVLLSGALLIVLSFLPAIVKRLRSSTARSAAATLLVVIVAQGWQPTSAAAQSAGEPIPTHEAFSSVLADVVRQPVVDYQRLVENRAGLDAYLSVLAGVDPTELAGETREVQLAFWINAYNACMLRLVADHYPIQKDAGLLARLKNSVAGRPENSVWQIPDVFSAKHCQVAGEPRSQDDIEHVIIRPMGEPRIHFAVNCAALSCPVMWPEAYEASTLNDQLDRAVSHLVENPAHFAVEGSTVRLNKVLDWFKDDFGGEEGLRAFMVDYAPAEAAALLADAEITFFDYDWTLNDVVR